MTNLSILQLASIALIGGLLGTGVMTLFMTIIDKSGLVNADMMRAVGSFFTKSLDNALLPGVLIHFGSGIVFAGIYGAILAALQPPKFNVCLAFSMAMGAFHGGIVSMMLVVAVAERHPLAKFRMAGFSVAGVHWIAHVLYGTVVGIVASNVIL
jgi:hypothetical protein